MCREVQSELVLAVVRELRELMGFDAEVESLARAIIFGRWTKLDFKKLASEEAHGKWLGQASPDGQPEWNSQLGLWSAIWNPLVFVYTSANRWDSSAQRILTIIYSWI